MKNVIITLMLLYPAALYSQDSGTDNGRFIENKVYTAELFDANSPVIDGILDDEAWQYAEWGGGFTQRQPYEGTEPSQTTAFKIIYDEENICIAFRMNDNESGKIERRGSRRDVNDGDWVSVSIDSYFDRRTAFNFTVTAAGVKGDTFISNDGKTQDITWDPVWYADVAHNESGWTAEMRIPFSQLRYSDQKEQVWGLQIERRLYRKEERSFWQFFFRDAAGTVSHFGELRGIQDIGTTRRIEILPYTLSSMERSLEEAGNPFASGQNNNFHAGVDAKIGVTSDITLDLTVNPDFGQVEADPSEVNLTAFESFFAEKRPFFTEGKNIFNYQIKQNLSQNIQRSGSPQNALRFQRFSSQDNLFYSRRIGRAPQYSPEDDDIDYVEPVLQSSIAAAAKLSGKTQNGLSIGIIEAVTVEEKADFLNLGVRGSTTVEPMTNYFAGRVLQDFRSGDTRLGGIVTATNRNLQDSHLKFLNEAAYTGGIDFSHTWDNRNYFLSFMSVFSHIRGDSEAMLRAQTASSRYFQRSDANHLEVDSTATSLSGHGGTFTIGKAGQGHIKYSLLTTWRSPGLELNDIGFLKEADFVGEVAALEYWSYNPSWLFRSFTLKFKQNSVWDFDGKKIALADDIKSGLDLHFDSILKNYGRFGIGSHRYDEGLTKTVLRGGPYFINPGIWHSHANIGSDTRRNVQVSYRYTWDIWDDDKSYMKQHRVTTTFRPSSSFSFNINPTFTKQQMNLQYVDTFEPNGGPRYIFGELNQETLAIVTRASYSITPTFTIEYYGQPFISNGRYSNFKKTTNPRADNYTDRFRNFTDGEITYDAVGDEYTVDDGAAFSFENPSFNFLQFRSNLVVRWEYNPGSTLFLVWSQGRTGDGRPGTFAFNDDVRDLFDLYPTNVLLVKFNHWFSY